MEKKKKVLIAAGGTGGHIFPALALARQLSANPNIEVVFAGGNLDRNRYFDKSAYQFQSTACGAFSSRNPLKVIRSVGKIGRGLWQSHRAIAKFRPDLAVGFGSYYTFPALIAALLHRIPVVLHEANSIPGKVNRLLSRYALVTGIHFPDTALHMPGKTAVVGMPLRPGFKKNSVSVEEARNYFDLDPVKPTLLVFGGSQGAQAINNCVIKALCSSINPSVGENLQVIHVTGHPEATSAIRYRYREWNRRACVKDFESRMDLAWQAADFVISRAGAGTISEAIEYEVPAILVPFPRAADNHQELNADFMVKTVGGAEKLLERDMDEQRLMRMIASWLDDGAAKVKEMHRRIAAYKKEKELKDLAGLIQDILYK